MGRFLLWFLIFALVHGYGGSIFSQAYAGDGDHSIDESPSHEIRKFNRSSFPPDFIFGAASAAFQVEGAWNEDGKGPSIWDNFMHNRPEMVRDHSNGDVAADSYHLYKEDVKLLKGMNMDAYRFSISWPRLLPNGKISGGVNEKGVAYYNNLINHLIANGIKPVVTLFHFDVPQALEEEYNGLLSHQIIQDYYDYSNLCFERFGDRVKQWITFNEPLSSSGGGYDIGIIAPGRCSCWRNNNCTAGDSSTEPYIVTHNILLAHAHAVRLYKTKYQDHQKGIIGISVVTSWLVPYSKSPADKQATSRALDFQIGWNLSPLVYGEYPKSMQTLVGNRLPKFTKEESNLLKGSFDFLGLNYYTANYVKDNSNFKPSNLSYSTDAQADSGIVMRNGKLIGKEAASSWLHFYPKGIRKVLLYVKHTYQDPIIYITENGVDENDDASLPLKTALEDYYRIKYYYRHLRFLHKAIEEGVKVRGYFGWSIMDNLEWTYGYTVRFGLNYVDFRNGLERYPKLSAKWFGKFLQK